MISNRPNYKGRGVSTRNKGGQTQEAATDIKNVLQHLLSSRASREDNRISLDNLDSDQILRSLTSEPIMHTRESKIVEAILVIASQDYPQTTTLDLSNNSLKSLRLFAKIGSLFPNLLNLSLMNNQLESYRELDYFSANKSTSPLKSLQQLILVGNPLCSHSQTDADTYAR